MSKEKIHPVYDVYDKTNFGKGNKPVSLHVTEYGAMSRVEERQKDLSEPAKKLVYYEEFPVED